MNYGEKIIFQRVNDTVPATMGGHEEKILPRESSEALEQGPEIRFFRIKLDKVLSNLMQFLSYSRRAGLET